MKNVFKFLGIICIIAAALFVSCGSVEPEDPDYTVTFMNGSTVVKTLTGKSEGDMINTSDAPTLSPADWSPPAIPSTAGFYKLTAGSITFVGWATSTSATATELPLSVEKSNVTLYAIWNVTGSQTWTTEGSGISTPAAAVSQMGSPTAGTRYALVLSDTVPITNAVRVVLDKPNSNLTIKSTSTRQVDIKSNHTGTTSTGNSNGVFLVVGGSSQDATISLTLDRIKLIGVAGVDADGTLNPGTALNKVNDSLVRVQNGATLILDGGSAIVGHINTDTNNNGLAGNGSAVCVYNGGQLFIKDATIEQNRADADTTNKNRVGGIFAIGTKTNHSVVEITTAYITDNQSATPAAGKTGHTNDIYITEYVDFTLAKSGNVTIKDFTINSDVNTAGEPAEQTIIKIPAAVKKDIILNLRSTDDSLANVKANWNGKVVLQADNYTLTPADVGCFKLGQFRGSSGFSTTDTGVNSCKILDNYTLELSEDKQTAVLKAK